jgi:hypothetical protein
MRNSDAAEALELDAELEVFALELLCAPARVLRDRDVERRVGGLGGGRARLGRRRD